MGTVETKAVSAGQEQWVLKELQTDRASQLRLQCFHLQAKKRGFVCEIQGSWSAICKDYKTQSEIGGSYEESKTLGGCKVLSYHVQLRWNDHPTDRKRISIYWNILTICKSFQAKILSNIQHLVLSILHTRHSFIAGFFSTNSVSLDFGLLADQNKHKDDTPGLNFNRYFSQFVRNKTHIMHILSLLSST